MTAPGGSLRRFAVPAIAAVAVAAADQWTKALIVRTFALYEAKSVFPDYLHIVHVRNRGVAFSMLSNLDHPWVNPLLVGVTVIAVFAVIGYIYYHPDRGPAPAGLGLILGGAVGNLIDRARQGYVVDFLDVHWKLHHWPAFNVADIGITVGVGLLMLDLLLGHKTDAV